MIICVPTIPDRHLQRSSFVSVDFREKDRRTFSSSLDGMVAEEKRWPTLMLTASVKKSFLTHGCELMREAVGVRAHVIGTARKSK